MSLIICRIPQFRSGLIIGTFVAYLTLNLLATTIVAPPSNASKWQMGFNSAFKGLILSRSSKVGRSSFWTMMLHHWVIRSRRF